MNITFQLTLLVILLIQFHSNNAELYCRDEHGDNVDWYIVYKLPKISEPLLNSTFGEGLRYAYIAGPAIGAKNAIKEWQLSSKEVGDRNSIFAKTLRPVYKEPKKFTSLLYNDDPAEAESAKSYIDSANSYWAHAKGVVAMDSETGFFLTHSIPRFPLAFNESKYEYPSSASNYGQTALCISFKTPSEANKILRHLQTLQPNIYYSNDANVLKDKSVFNDVIGKVALNETLAIRTIKSYNGKLFTAFGKNSKADGDLYGAYIAPYLKNDLSVQTWRRGAGEPLPSN
ncbi:Deoxyribonuclease-2-like protein, partial [Leptotrombidium deliense]